MHKAPVQDLCSHSVVPCLGSLAKLEKFPPSPLGRSWRTAWRASDFFLLLEVEEGVYPRVMLSLILEMFKDSEVMVVLQ